MKWGAPVAVVAAAVAVLAWLGTPPAPPPGIMPGPTPLAGALPAPERPVIPRALDGARSLPSPATAASAQPLPPVALLPLVAVPVPDERPAPAGDPGPPGRPAPAARPLVGHPAQTRRLLEWAARDPHAAARWADDLIDPALRQEALEVVCFKVAETEPATAADMVERFALEDAPGVVENLAAHWAAADPSAALEWAERRSAGEIREALIGRIAFVLAASQPDESVRLILERMTPGPRQVEAAASVVHQWGLQDAASARQWVESLPEGPLRDRAHQELERLASDTP
jgi:hypothetical protein